ncbi:MAG: sugar phosphate isomerase/epimerase [Nitrospirae bacterium]|nr:sugar phosphate isomerase/epimerase [Nitrospirota bacterium]
MEPYSYHAYIPFSRLRQDLEFLTPHAVQPEVRLNAEDLDSLKMKDVEKLARELPQSLHVTVHAPYRDLSPGAFDRRVRTATRERLEELLEVAEVLRARSVVCHLGYEPKQHHRHTDEWLQNSVETWSHLAETAQNAGIRIALENVYEDSPVLHQKLLELLKDDSMGICIDVGHANLYSKVSVRNWFDALKDHIIELHLHDNDGTEDQHLPLGRGKIDFEKILKEDLPLVGRPLLTLELVERDAIPESLSRIKQALGA